MQSFTKDCNHQWQDIASILSDGKLYGMHCCESGGHNRQYYWCSQCGTLKRELKIPLFLYPSHLTLDNGAKQDA